VYPVGIDPIWYMSKNELTYVNSLKMKLSVIFGVLQMSLGVFMKALNSIHYKRPIDFFFEFVPQILLLMALFGFMDMIIIIKWLTDYY
jgi:V-type H+-transporting ATPase subunit a